MNNKILIIAFLLTIVTCGVQAQSDSLRTARPTQESSSDTTQANPTGTIAPSTSPAANPSGTASSGINDDDLKKYAVVMDSIDNMKKSLLAEITKMVKSNSKITGARYNELSKIATDDAKLAAAKATPEEISFIKQVASTKEEGANHISQTFQTLAREYIGVEEYNMIKTALTEDPSLKERYNTILAEVDKDDDAQASK